MRLGLMVLRRGKSGWLWALALAPFAAVAWLLSVFGQETPVGSSPQSGWVVRIAYDDQRNPIAVEHKWPFGSPENIRIMRVPWGYRHMIFGPSAGAQLMDNIHQPSRERGYGGAFIWALLPDVSAHGGIAPEIVSRDVDKNLLRVRIAPVINKEYPYWDGKAWFQRHARGLLKNLNIGPTYRDVPIVSLSPRFGLNRIGPERLVIDPNYEKRQHKPGPPPHEDLWFDDDTLEESRTLIECGTDYLANGEYAPDFGGTLCEHFFAHDGLNASVKLTYWKKHLANWKDIQQRVSTLLDSFKTDEKPKD